MNELIFFKNLALNISSSLEPAKAWSRTFPFLAEQLPIDAISLHSFNFQLRTLHLEFLVQNNRYLELDRICPLTDEEIAIAEESEIGNKVKNIPYASKDPVAAQHLKGIEDYLDAGDRAYLIIVLKTEEGVAGHLCLIGKTVDCFTREHEDKLRLMQAPIGLALMNMHRHSQTEELKKRLDAEKKQLAGEVNLLKEDSIIGARGGLHKTMEMIGQLAGKETPALIFGETGTGKELIADAIQRISPRTNKPYIRVNCGAIPDSLIDSELFGHQRGAFTGAISNKIGRFERADGGTLFLDEIGDLPLPVQVRLLRVLQSGTLERVGGEKTIQVDVRIIAATNRSLEAMLQAGNFREDLFYRLNVFPIKIPSLRERTEDIPLLIRHFIKELSSRLKLSNEVRINTGTMEKLKCYSWPGNVRELKNLVERGLTIDPYRDLDLTRYLPKDSGWYLCEEEKDSYLKELMRQEIHAVLAKLDLKKTQTDDHKTTAEPKTLDQIMIDHISAVLAQCNGKINGPGGAAEILAINPNTLRKRMAKLKIPFGYKG